MLIFLKYLVYFLNITCIYLYILTFLIVMLFYYLFSGKICRYHACYLHASYLVKSFTKSLLQYYGYLVET